MINEVVLWVVLLDLMDQVGCKGSMTSALSRLKQSHEDGPS